MAHYVYFTIGFLGKTHCNRPFFFFFCLVAVKMCVLGHDFRVECEGGEARRRDLVTDEPHPPFPKNPEQPILWITRIAKSLHAFLVWLSSSSEKKWQK